MSNQSNGNTSRFWLWLGRVFTVLIFIYATISFIDNPNNLPLINGIFSFLQRELPVVGEFALSAVVVPIIKAVPALIFGLYARSWWEKRSQNRKKPS